MSKQTPHVQHRPMHTRSKAFEAGYSSFLDDVFAQGISSVATEETAAHRMLVFAGFHRTVASKRTGLLHCEHFDRESGTWRPTRAHYLPAFWAKTADILYDVSFAWRERLRSYLPKPEVCFPKLTKVQLERGDTTESLHDKYVRLAADRRLASSSVRGAAKQCVVAGMWNYLVDREVLKLCFAIFGRKAGMAEYNYTMRHRDVLAARERETPSLTPLIGFYLKNLDPKLSDRTPPPLNVIALAKARLFSGTLTLGEHFIGRAVVDRTVRADLAPQGWRYLTTLTRNAIEQMWRIVSNDFERGGHQGLWLVRPLNMLARTGESPPLEFILWWVIAVNRLERDTPTGVDIARGCEGLGRFLRLAAAQATKAAKRSKLKRFVTGDLALAWDWMLDDQFRGQHAHLGRIRWLEKNMTWPAVMRAQHEWHATAAAREEARRAADRVAYAKYLAGLEALSWESQLGQYVIDEVKVLPLTTGKALRKEGKQMTHCVGGANYITECDRGTVRIFSLRGATERATVELYNDGGSSWKVGQVFNRENTESSRKMWVVAKTVARDYTEAARKAKAQTGTSA